MAIIFINYRRSDSRGWTRSLHDRLANTFGVHSIFYDVDDVRLGENFVSSINQNLTDCRIVLVVIGPDWLKKNADGTRRIDHPDDYVRREIEIAMQKNLMIIPVLVGGAQIPSHHELPPSVAGLEFREVLEVSDDWRYAADMERLISRIQEVCGIQREAQQFTAPVKKKGFSGLSFILGGVVAIIVALFGLGLLIALIAYIPNENGNSVVDNRTPSISPTSTPKAANTFETVITTDGEKRVKFAPGKSSTTFSGSVIRGEQDIYVIGAREGQTMSLKITSAEDNAVFQVIDADGEYLRDAGEEDDATNWTGNLPFTGDYRIIVSGTRGNASYNLSVTIKSNSSGRN